MIRLRSGNIWSGSRALAVLTNPTELAKRKGNLNHSYPITFRDKRYADAEAAYQNVKRSGPWLDQPAREQLCTEVVIAKLEQYPILMQTITASGGEDWIKKCSHIVNGRITHAWEGHGIDSGFIRCLLTAYQAVPLSEDSPGERPAQQEGSEMSSTKHVKIYADGACSGNPGPGGWAAILQWNSHEREVAGYECQTTNNRMELTAVIEGFNALKEPCPVTVYTDSQYVIGAMTGWKRKANHDLLAKLDVLCAQHTVTFQYVRGHAGHPLNERADALAAIQRERARSAAPIGAG